VKIGLTLAVSPVSIWPGFRLTPLPSRWHELQLPLPLKSAKPAISSCTQRDILMEERVVFRRKSADIHRGFILVEGFPPVIKYIVGSGAVLRR